MRLTKIRIKNFRVFQDVSIDIDPYTCLVGPNGAGKSTVLTALNIFFRHTSDAATDLVTLTEEDFHQKNTSEPVEITLTFEDLNKQAQESLTHYVRQGKLVVSAVADWSAEAGRAAVRQIGHRLGMKEFAPFFAAYDHGHPAAEVSSIYDGLRDKFPELSAQKGKDKQRAALWAYETAHPDCLAELPSNEEFYGVSRGKNLLAPHIQWVYVPAVKHSREEEQEAKNTAIGLLLERTVRTRVTFKEDLDRIRDDALRRYGEVLDSKKAALDELARSLTRRIQEWAHPDAEVHLVWDQNKAVSVTDPFARVDASDGLFTGRLARHGHGFQRSYLLAVLQELASAGGSEDRPTLLLGCEEPELYQHPPQARHLVDVLERLSEGDAQIVVSTHCRYFVSGRGFEAVRMVRRSRRDAAAQVHRATWEQMSTALSTSSGKAPERDTDVRAKLDQALQPDANEIFFTQVLVLVEGIEDVAYLQAHLRLSGRWTDYRRLGVHIHAARGKGFMARLIVVAKELRIPTLVILDGDADEEREEPRRKHERDNRTILNLCGVGDAPTFPAEHLWRDGVVVWAKRLREAVVDDVGAERFKEAEGRVRRSEKLGVKGLDKNPLFIGYTLETLHRDGVTSALLDRLCAEVITFGEQSAGASGKQG